MRWHWAVIPTEVNVNSVRPLRLRSATPKSRSDARRSLRPLKISHAQDTHSRKCLDRARRSDGAGNQYPTEVIGCGIAIGRCKRPLSSFRGVQSLGSNVVLRVELTRSKLLS